MYAKKLTSKLVKIWPFLSSKYYVSTMLSLNKIKKECVKKIDFRSGRFSFEAYF